MENKLFARGQNIKKNLNAAILVEFRDAAVKDVRSLFEDICAEAEILEQYIEVIAQEKLNGIAHL